MVRADLRNHGDSPHAKSMSYREMTDDVLALLDRLVLDKTYLMGHSLGGKVAMVCALLCPQRVRQLIVIDIAPVAYGQGFDDIIESLHALTVLAIATTYLVVHLDGRGQGIPQFLSSRNGSARTCTGTVKVGSEALRYPPGVLVHQRIPHLSGLSNNRAETSASLISRWNAFLVCLSHAS